MQALRQWGPLIGRILMAIIFIQAGIGKIGGFEQTVGYIASKGLPLPQIGAIIAIIVEIGGGVLLVLGWRMCWAAGILFIFTAATALFFHNFWAMPPEQVQMQSINFFKNLAIMGGLLYMVVYGSGPMGMDSKRHT